MTLGARLAAAREARGVSLEDLARRTRIPLTGLRALEADAHERLPPPIFARGYVRACAEELGLDPETLLARFDAERPPSGSPLDAAPLAPVVDDAPASVRFYRSRRVASIAAAACLIALVIWSGRDPGVTGALPPPPSVAMAAPEPVGTTGQMSVAPEIQGVSAVLKADRECWVTARADGERVVYRLMQPGEREAVQARERIWLRIGDAGAVTLSLNEGAPQLVGADGAVRTLVLNAGDPPALFAPPPGSQGN